MATNLQNPTAAKPAASSSATSSKLDQYVRKQLKATTQQVRISDLVAGILALLAYVLAFFFIVSIVDAWFWPLSVTGRTVALVILVIGGCAIAWFSLLPLLLRKINPQYAAKMIENAKPEFKNSLLNYLSIRRDKKSVHRAILNEVSRKAATDLSTVSPDATVDKSNVIRIGFVLVGLVAAVIAYSIFSPKSPLPTVMRVLTPGSKISKPAAVLIQEVSPQDTFVFFGDRPEITAKIHGVGDDDEVRLVYSSKDMQIVDASITMQHVGPNGTFQAILSPGPAGIQQPLYYRVEAGDGVSPTYSVDVRPNPSISVESIKITPPKYTGLPERKLEGHGEIQAVEGSQVEITARANLPIELAYIVPLIAKSDSSENSDYREMRTIQMSADEDQAVGRLIAALNANRDKQQFTHYKINFRSKNNFRNDRPNVYPIRVIADLAPEIEMVEPAQTELTIPVNQPLAIEVLAADLDYEISSIDLHVDHNGNRILDHNLLRDPKGKTAGERIRVRHSITPKDLRLSPGDQAILFASAADNRVSPSSELPDPNVSRTTNYTLIITDPIEDPQKNQQQNNDQQNQDQKQDKNQEQQDPSQSDSNQQKESEQQSEEQQQNESGSNMDNSQSEKQQDQESQAESQEQSGDGTQQPDQGSSGEQQNVGQPDSDSTSQPGSGSSSVSNESKPGDESESSSQSESSDSGDSKNSDPESSGNQSDRSGNAGDFQDGTPDQNAGEAADSNSGTENSATNDPANSDGSRGANQDESGGGEQQFRDESLTDGDVEPLRENASESEQFERLKKYFDKQSDKQDDKKDGSDNQRRTSDRQNQGTSEESEQQPSGGNEDQPQDANDSPSQEQSPGNDSAPQANQSESNQRGSKANQSENNAQQPGTSEQASDGNPEQPAANGAESSNGSPDQNQSGSGSRSKPDAKGEQSSTSGDSNQPDSQSATGKGENSDQSSQSSGKTESDRQPGEQSSNLETQSANESGSGNDSEPSTDRPDSNSSQQNNSESFNSTNSERQDSHQSDNSNSAEGQPSNQVDKSASSQDSQSPDGQQNSSQAESESESFSKSTDTSNETPGKHGGTGGSSTQRKEEPQEDGPANPDQPNLDYAKKVTDLVLEKLEDQKYEPDPKLLEQLNWTKDDMDQFLKRWKQMRDKADTGDIQSKKSYESALRSLGLSPKSSGRVAKGTKDKEFRLNESGAVDQVPAEYLDKFNSFLKRRNRSKRK